METDVPVREVMVREVVKGDANLTVQEAVEIMRRHDVNSIIVTNHGEPVGIVTEGDILDGVVKRDLKPSEVKLKDIMTSPLITVSPDDSLLETARKMATLRIRKMPVVENGKLVGFVSDVDILAFSSEMNSILAELVEMSIGREISSASEEVSQGICERCGAFSSDLKLVGGMMLCESCRDEEGEQ
ncbi:MAG: CBS domain-containing protein [Candidatus Methanospirare jalkutatii]|nr:CBS domain-containing protein [Candidatus Methanospirare jalkutatii]